MRIYNNITELVGNTPLVKLHTVGKEYQPNIIVKLEYFNPSGSVKDRAALNMIAEAEKQNLLRPGSHIIEATSGNTGIALATIAAAKGYRITLVIPDTMSQDKINHIKALGAEVILTPGVFGMKKAFIVADELKESNPEAFQPNQIKNINNPLSHIRTAREIIDDTDGNIDFFVAGSGTGGTITGVGRELKQFNPEIKIICVEPKGSPVLSGGKRGPHKIQGIGPGFIPDIMDLSVIDEILPIEDNDALTYGRELARKEGIFVGISSGAAVAAAMVIAKRHRNEKLNIIALLADTGERYLSTELFNENINENYVI